MNTKQLYIVLGAFLIVLLCIGIGWYMVYSPNSHNADTTQLSISQGSSITGIATVLKEAGVIRSETVFTVYARFSGKSRLLQAGLYVMPKNLSVHDIVERVVRGEGSQSDIRVTVPEGFTNTQVFLAMQKAGLQFEKSEFERVTSTGYIGEKSSIIYDGKPETRNLSGYLFPDTYNFFADSTPEQIVEKMVANFVEKITPEMRAQIEESQYSFYEILTLASIVEKEVGSTADRKVVAGIFLQRLEDNHPLESDATLNYITGKKDTRATASDVVIDSPYNSYANVGLPPTPICNPGMDVIRAVLEPTQTDYYFFLTTPEGEALYSRTYEEHLQKKAIYYP